MQTHHCSEEAVSFEQVFLHHKDYVFRLAFAMLGDQAEAEDAVQEIFLRVYRALNRYDPQRARLSTWLYRIATNLALNELRRPRRKNPHRSAEDEAASELVSEAPTTDDVVHARRESASVEAELAALPERQRAALVLSVVDGLSYAEIAVALEVSEKAVKALVHRARSTLAAKLRGQGVDAPLPAAGPRRRKGT